MPWTSVYMMLGLGVASFISIYNLQNSFVFSLSVFEWRRFFRLFLVRNGNKFQVQLRWLGLRMVKFNVKHLKRRRPYFGRCAIRHSENLFKSICKLICYVNVCSLLAYSQHSLAERNRRKVIIFWFRK